jgi:hypothetical protein
MLPSINHVLEHDEIRYLIECEDLGRDKAAFEVRISAGGNLLWHKRLSYQELLAGRATAGELELEVRARMERTVETAKAAVAQGKVEALSR